MNKHWLTRILASVGVVVAALFAAVPADAQLATPQTRPNGDYYDVHTFRFSNQPVAAAVVDTLVGGDTTNAVGNMYVAAADALWLSWTTANINNMDSTFVKFQVRASNGTWTDATGAHVRDTMTAAGTRQKALTVASFNAWPMMRAVIFQKNQAGNTATDSVSVKVTVDGLFKGR